MSVFVAYSDEAGVGDKGEFLVSGYVAEESEWPWIAKAWQERVLDGPPPISAFHMTEMRSRGWRNENGVSFNDSENRITEAVNILRSHGALYAVGSVISQALLKEIIHSLFPKRVPVGIDEPDYLCHQAFFAIVLNDIYDRDPSVERVNFFFGKKNKTITRNVQVTVQNTVTFLEENYPHLAPLMGEVLPATPAQALPLQCADTISWHLQRYYGDRHTGRKTDRIDESRMWHLLKERDGHLHTWDRDSLEELAQSLDKIRSRLLSHESN